jgi:hypothetical protein
MPAAGRRTLLLGGAALLAGAADAEAASDYAVFTELSPESKLMQPGWNRRIFTNTDSRKGDAVQCDFATGVLTLTPGSYQLSGMSMVLYGAAGDPPETTTIRSPAAAGYCRLRTFDPSSRVDTSSLRALDNGDPSVICIGSPASANMVPSVFDAFLEAGKPTQLVLEHQSGDKPDQIYLRVYTEKSKWHALARISIRRL